MIKEMHKDFSNKRMFKLHGLGGLSKISVINIIGSAIWGDISKLKGKQMLVYPRRAHMILMYILKLYWLRHAVD